MRHAVLFIALLCIGASAMTYEPPKPGLKTLAVTVRRDAFASVVWVKWSISATGGPDSTTVDVTGPTSLHRRYNAASKVDSVSYPAPAANGTINGTVSATAWRRGLSASSGPKPWTYTEPDVPPPPPSVTVEVIPASVSMAPFSKTKFCTILCGQTCNLASNSADSDDCQRAFIVWLGTKQV